jgi:hypothetical protein
MPSNEQDGTSQDPIRAQIAQAVPNLIKWVAEQLPSLDPNPPMVETLTFADVITYFTKAPADPRIAAGALLRRPRADHHFILQIFLDETNDVCSDNGGKPYGRTLIARHLDAELSVKFSETDLILFR